MLINNFIKKEGRALPVFILLDVSGSMKGEKIETVNVALKEMINSFKKIENPKGIWNAPQKLDTFRRCIFYGKKRTNI